MWLGWWQMIPPPPAFEGVSKWGQLTVQTRVSISSLVTHLAKDRMCHPISTRTLLHTEFLCIPTLFKLWQCCWLNRSKLWQTMEAEKCFWLLEQHLLKILRSFWTSGYEWSLVLFKGRVNFIQNKNLGIEIYKSWDKTGYTYGTEVYLGKDRTWVTADMTTHALDKKR
jgi:hypothetical protein